MSLQDLQAALVDLEDVKTMCEMALARTRVIQQGLVLAIEKVLRDRTVQDVAGVQMKQD